MGWCEGRGPEGHRGHEEFERHRRQHRGGPPWAMWGDWDPGGRHGGGRGGPGGPPPWVAELLGFARPERSAPKRRRGDVRMAILAVLRDSEEAPNGYQVIQTIAERSDGAWKPSPGSVYPTIQQLEDEGLVETDEVDGRRAHRLTRAGRDYCEDRADELAGLWRPFERQRSNPWPGEGEERHADIKGEIPQVMSAIWQIASGGSPAQREAALDVLVDARRRLYGILADGPDQDPRPED